MFIWFIRCAVTRPWRIAALLLSVSVACPAIECTAAEASATALPGLDARWSLMRSQNFTLYAHQAGPEARDILHELEVVRALALEQFGLAERTRSEITVFAFSSRKDFEAYVPGPPSKTPRPGAYSSSGRDRTVIAMAPPEKDDNSRRLVRRHSVYHVFRVADRTPPLWFSEGVADLLSTLRLEGDTVQLGHPLPDHVRTVRKGPLLALETLWAVADLSGSLESDARNGIFFAQSWALMHFWICGGSDLPADGIQRFTRSMVQPVAPRPEEAQAAFPSCFGVSTLEMNKRLQKHVSQKNLPFSVLPRPPVALPTSYALSAVPVDEMRIRLGELALRLTRSEAGEVVVRDAVRSRPDDPLPLELLGALSAANGAVEDAVVHWERAIAAGSRNPAIARELALIACEPWMREFDPEFRLSSAETGHLRAGLVRAIELEPQQSAAYERLAWVEAYADECSVANVNFVQDRFYELPGRARTLVALAQVRARLGSSESALKLLKRLASMEADLWTRQAAETLTARLENRPARRLAEADDGTGDGPAAGPVVESRIRIPSVPLPEDLR